MHRFGWALGGAIVAGTLVMGSFALAQQINLSNSVRACENSAGDLVLRNANGTCPRGTTAVTVLKRAPLPKPEAWHTVGAAGEPGFVKYSCGSAKTCEWRPAPSDWLSAPPAFYKDPFGVVHLRGAGCWSNRLTVQDPGRGECFNDDQGNSTKADPLIVFRLPTGYRPEFGLVFPNTATSTSDRAPSFIRIDEDGQMTVYNSQGSSVHLDGITFRAA